MLSRLTAVSFVRIVGMAKSRKNVCYFVLLKEMKHENNSFIKSKKLLTYKNESGIFVLEQNEQNKFDEQNRVF